MSNESENVLHVREANSIKEKKLSFFNYSYILFHQRVKNTNKVV